MRFDVQTPVAVLKFGAIDAFRSEACFCGRPAGCRIVGAVSELEPEEVELVHRPDGLACRPTGSEAQSPDIT